MGSQDTHPQVSTRADKTASQLCTQSTTAVVARNMGQSGKRGAVGETFELHFEGPTETHIEGTCGKSHR